MTTYEISNDRGAVSRVQVSQKRGTLTIAQTAILEWARDNDNAAALVFQGRRNEARSPQHIGGTGATITARRVK